MKKPKKTTAAKPRARKAASSRAKSGTLTAKTEAGETPKKKAAVKKARKVAAKISEPAASETVKSVATAKALGKVKPVATAKAVVAAKPVVEIKPPVQAEPSSKLKRVAKPKALEEVKPKLLAEPVVKATPKSEPEIKAEPPAKIEAEAKPVAKPKRLVTAKIAPAPVTEAKASAVVEPVAKVKSVPPGKRPVEAKPAIVPGPAVETKLSVQAKSVVEAKAPIEKPVSPVAAKAKPVVRPLRKAPTEIPAILLEGDKPEPAQVSGPGHRYALGPKPPVEKLQTEGELPESYGTGAILLTARDPHWLYTHWDLSGDQQRRYNGYSRDGHLIVRIYIEAPGGKPFVQVHVHPESRHWFVHVERANTRYVAELGYYSAADKWTVVSTSAATLTPPDAVSTESVAEFGTIPFEVPMEKLLSLVKEAVQENAPLAQALQELRAEGHPELPKFDAPPQAAGEAPLAQRPGSKWTPSEWTPAQERALAEVVSMDHVRRVWMGSLEITELIRRQFINELASMTAAELGALPPGGPTSPTGAVTGISSPAGKAAQQPKGFWFNVNAELIVYGATERDATVSIGGRKIKLRPDGSFSYRFALPDGNYEMPVVAISADETDGRAAEMKFSRGTEYRGDVGAHPQDPSLQQLILEKF